MKNSIRSVLFISTNAQFGGSEVLWSEMACKLHKSGTSVNCIIHNWRKLPMALDHIKDQGCKVFTNNNLKSSLLNKILVKSKIRSRDGFKSLIQKASVSINPELAIVSVGDHASEDLPAICDELKVQKIPYVILIQLANEFRDITDGLSQKLLSSYRDAKKCFFLCKKNQKIVENHIGEILNNSATFQSPFNTERLNDPSFVYEGDKDVYNIGMVTNLNTFHKGHDLILQALNGEKWKNRNYRINIYGNGDNLELIKRLIHCYDLEDKVQLRGYVSSAEEIWRHNQACLFVSRMEGQSLAMLDAISLDRMVIATNVGDAENLVADNETGFLIDCPSSSLIDHVLDKAWEKRELWLSMGAKGKLKLKTIFKQDPIDKLINRINEL